MSRIFGWRGCFCKQFTDVIYDVWRGERWSKVNEFYGNFSDVCSELVAIRVKNDVVMESFWSETDV
jgi:hypothetical protein